MATTTGAAWRQMEEHTLPSGKVARLRKPDVFALATSDGVPDFFTQQVLAGLKGHEAKLPTAEEMGPEDLRQLGQLLDLFTRACFGEPVIVDKPEAEMGEHEIGIQHVEIMDKLYVYQWAMGGEESRAAQSFLEKQGAGLDALRAGNDVPAEPGGPAGAE